MREPVGPLYCKTLLETTLTSSLFCLGVLAMVLNNYLLEPPVALRAAVAPSETFHQQAVESFLWSRL